MFGRSTIALAMAVCALFGTSPGCAPLPEEASDCGPTTATVTQVFDGDTIEIDGDERVRYLLIDTPENTTKQECFGPQATDFNRQLVEGREIKLSYDVECHDRFDRLLAYVQVDDRDVNAMMVERGFACVLQIPPNGERRVDEFDALEDEARDAGRGLWGACERSPC